MKIFENSLMALVATFIIVLCTGCANATIVPQTAKQTVSVQNNTPYRLVVGGVVIPVGQSKEVTIVTSTRKYDARNTLREDLPGVLINATASYFNGGCLPTSHSVGECWKNIPTTTTNIVITPKDFGQ